MTVAGARPNVATPKVLAEPTRLDRYSWRYARPSRYSPRYCCCYRENFSTPRRSHVTSGIYCWRTPNGLYVGSAVNLAHRRNGHLKFLRLGTHDNKFLQHAFDKHGDNFKFEILLLCDPSDLIRCEQHFIDTLKPRYNICKIAGSVLGLKWSAFAKRNVSSTMKKRIAVDPVERERLKAISDTFWSDPENKFTAKTRQRVIAKALWNDPTFKEKMRTSAKARWSDPETKAKKSSSLKLLWIDPAYRAKMQAKHKSRFSCEDAREKLKAQSKAYWANPEFRAKRAEMMRLRWADPIKRSEMLEALRGA